jgi:hypothetical protein
MLTIPWRFCRLCHYILPQSTWSPHRDRALKQIRSQ